MSKGRKTTSADELIEALLEPRVLDAITEAIVTKVSDALMAKFSAKLDSKFSDLSQSLKDLRSKTDTMASAITVVQTSASDLAKRVEQLERYQRQENLIIHGLKEASYSERASAAADATHAVAGNSTDVIPSNPTTKKMVLDFFRNCFQVDLRPDDISVARRLRNNSSSRSNQPLPVIVRFTNKKSRMRVLTARKNLKTSSPGVFINEHLSSTDSTIFARSRNMMKNKQIFKTWTQNGFVMVKKDNSSTSRPIKISCIADLNQF